MGIDLEAMQEIIEVNKLEYGLFEPKESVKSFKDISCGEEKAKKKALIYKFDTDIEIVPIFDSHLGLKACDKQKLIETVEYILSAPNRYTILGGDILECATRTSVGLAMYEEDLSPKDQLFHMYELLKPLADAGKILDVLTGNHEMRLANFADMNPAEILARQLKVPYSGYQGYIVLKLKEQTYKIAYFHGKSNGTTPAGVMSAMRKQANVAEADIYLSGHIHVKAKDSDTRYVINEETGEISIKPRKYVICGSFVDYWGSYAEMQALPPAETGSVSIVFSAEKWSIDPYVPES